MQVVDRQVRVQFDSALFFLLFDDRFEWVGFLGRLRLEPEDDVAVHLDESPVAVPRESFVAAGRCQAAYGVVVEAQVENRIHHARHRHTGARPDGHEQRVRGIAEALVHHRFESGQRVFDLLLEPGRVGALVGVVQSTNLGGDRKARGHGQAQARHLGQVGALAAEQILHVGAAFRAAAGEKVDVLLTSNATRPRATAGTLRRLFLPRCHRSSSLLPRGSL